MQAIVDTINNWFSYLMSFLTDVIESITDFITDLPVILLEAGTNFLNYILDQLGAYCSYCLGGATIDGTGSAVSKFALFIQDGFNALSPCVLYALNQSGIAGCLQILSCAMVIWMAMRLVALVRSIT